MLQLVEELKNRYPDRLTIFDMPPILAEDDVIAFLPYIDAVMLVVEEGRTSRSDLTRAVQLLGEKALMGLINEDNEMNIDPQQLAEITQRLVETYHPKRLILFGSQVWGIPNEDSDVDILVEVEQADEPSWQRARRGYKALFGMGVPCDILVRTTDEMMREQAIPVTLMHHIVMNGRVIHE